MTVHADHNVRCPHAGKTLCGLDYFDPREPGNYLATMVDCQLCIASRRGDGVSCCVDYTPPAPGPVRRRGGSSVARNR